MLPNSIKRTEVGCEKKTTQTATQRPGNRWEANGAVPQQAHGEWDSHAEKNSTMLK